MVSEKKIFKKVLYFVGWRHPPLLWKKMMTVILKLKMIFTW